MTDDDVDGQPVISFAAVPECEAWFAENHRDHRGFWLKIGKASGPTTVTYAEALEIALCHGWIDGQKRGLDEAFWLQRFTPRGPRSKWSQINRDKAEALIAAGAMSRPSTSACTSTPCERRAVNAIGVWPPIVELTASGAALNGTMTRSSP